VEGVIDLAHKLGIAVVAEDVESETQMAILVAANCDETQGFLLSQPLSFDALTYRFGASLDASARIPEDALQGTGVGKCL
jgi:EAL domain-containing protein (putative c-di-GMP-specific phosphodiesterase class I)